MKTARVPLLPASLAAMALLLVSSSLAQDGGLGRGRRGGGGGGGGGTPAPPRPSSPPRQEPPARRSDPAPSREPRRSDPAPSNPGPSNPGPLDRGRDRNPGGDSGGNPGAGDRPQRGGSYPSGTFPNTRPGRDPFGSGAVVRGPSRSGQVRYGTVNNAPGSVRPFRVDRAPVFADGNGLPNRVYRQERVGVVDGYRIGYYHYNRSWRDDYFAYPFYTFSPFGFSCVSSPFYGYAFVPGYLSTTRVVYVNGYQSPWIWNDGNVFNWNSGYNGYDNGYNDGRRDERRRDDDARSVAARNAVADLRDAFEDGDPRLLSRLMARRGQVAILRDGRYDYSVNVADFDDLVRDLVSNSRTRSYRVEETRSYDGSIRVVARHDYQDPWGERQTMYHHILLEPERGGYVIREFGTSPSRFW